MELLRRGCVLAYFEGVNFSPQKQASNDFLPGLDPDPAGLDHDALGAPSAYEVGRYTAAEFLRREPYKAEILVKLLGKGLGQLECARLLRCSVHTVRAVLLELPENIAIERERQRKRLRAGAALVLDGILEDLSDPEKMAAIPTRDKAVILGILEDKAAGPAPASVNIHVHSPGHRDLDGYLQRLQTVGPDSTGGGSAEMGFGPGTGGAKGAGLVEDAEVSGHDSTGTGGETVDGSKVGKSDSESDAQRAESVKREGFTDV